MILEGEINDTNEIKYIDTIRNYIKDKNIDKTKTYHTFEDNLPPKIKMSFNKLKNGTIMNNLKEILANYNIINVTEMNELATSAIGSDGSDKVFENIHVDGLYAVYPFCILFRCILGITGNNSIETIFPLDDKNITIKTNKYLLFDYNRICHYIKKNNINDNSHRIILKIHYAAIPKILNNKFIITPFSLKNGTL
jgi:hypothetical protein